MIFCFDLGTEAPWRVDDTRTSEEGFNDGAKANNDQRHSTACRERHPGQVHVMISYDKLGKDYLAGRATMPVDEANHREFVRGGIRYFCGWSSEKHPDRPGGVVGWLVYKSSRPRRSRREREKRRVWVRATR